MADTTELNRVFFDDEAATYDAKHEKATAEIAKRIEDRLGFIGVGWIEDVSDDDEVTATAPPKREVKILDYACGTGAMSRAFAPYATRCVGIDLSDKMVHAYNLRARNQGLNEDEMSAYSGNICIPGDEDPEPFRGSSFFHFDMAIVGLGFHHFDDPALAAERLVARLKPGGVLVILDFLPHGEFHQHGHGHTHEHGHSHDSNGATALEKASKTVTHHGFTEERIRKIFEDAGAGKDFAIVNMGDVTMGRIGKRSLFLARGTKAS